MTSVPAPPAGDPLGALRAFQARAPWGLRDLTSLAGAILESSGIEPRNLAARARPTERTLRFYVARGLVNPPEGRGTAAVYGYRHLLQVLGIKLRQMDGATLEAIEAEFADLSLEALERRLALALGARLPAPDEVNLADDGSRRRARWGAAAAPARDQPSRCCRIPVSPGVELLVDEGHPALQRAGDPAALAARVRDALGA